MERRTLGQLRLDANIAVMRLYNPLGDRQSKPRSAFRPRARYIDPVETFENTGNVLLIYAAAAVPNNQMDQIRAFAAVQLDRSVSRCIFQSVVEQDYDQLANPSFIPAKYGSFLNIGVYRYTFRLGQITELLGNILQERA